MHKKQACLFKRGYMINNKENQAEKEKQIPKETQNWT